MRKRIRPLISMSVLVIMIGVIFFAGKPQPTAGQNSPFRNYQLRVFCDDSGVVTATFWHDVGESMGLKIICVGNCGGDGPVTLESALGGLPSRVSTTLWQMVNAHQADAAAGIGRPLTCLGGDPPPGKEEKLKCEPPSNSPQPPWFNPDIPCGDRTRGIISWKLVPGTRDRAYTVKMCGQVISYTLPRGAGPPSGMRVGGGGSTNAPGARVFDVCCDSWRNAANTKSPCDPRTDIDCDGILNVADRFAEIPEDRRIWRDYFYYNGPNLGTANDIWTKLHPPDQSECKDCKWELVRYESTCKSVPDPTASDRYGQDIFDANHRVKATWKCPANGQTKENEETVIVQSIGCPRPEPTAPGFRPTSSRIFGSGLFTNPSMAVLPGSWTKPCFGSRLESGDAMAKLSIVGLDRRRLAVWPD